MIETSMTKTNRGSGLPVGALQLLACLLAICASAAQGGTLFLGAYPNTVLVFDEEKGTIVDRIALSTGTPLGMRLTPDKTKLYVKTIDHNGLEVIDVATRKVINSFALNTATKQYRFWGGAPNPSGKFYYTVTKEIDKFADHYDVAKPKYTTIDLSQHRIVKTVDIPAEEEKSNQGGFGSGSFEVSPDGKYLYQFGRKIVILSSDDFKVVDRIDLARPDLPGMENVRFGGNMESIGEPGQHISVFNSADPFVHNRVFGLARFDLNTRQFSFNPIGPAPMGMAGLQVSSDKRTAYTVVASGANGNKRCEFWAFDLASDSITRRAEFSCRTRFSFGISSNGQKLYIYGAGFEIEVYDAATLRYERTWDLNNDLTFGMAVLP
jgi:DNA-binding beta-propeller fold protein YncE